MLDDSLTSDRLGMHAKRMGDMNHASGKKQGSNRARILCDDKSEQ